MIFAEMPSVVKGLANETEQDYQWIGRRASPPHAEVHRGRSNSRPFSLRVSPARGGSPPLQNFRAYVFGCLSRTRGFTVARRCPRRQARVSPPHAGVHRAPPCAHSVVPCV